MASSADYGESKFNLAAQGHRQPGSAFKIMALMAALRRASTRTRRTTSPSRRSSTTRPRARSSPTYDGSRRLDVPRAATLKSDNSVYIQLALDIGPDKVKQTA